MTSLGAVCHLQAPTPSASFPTDVIRQKTNNNHTGIRLIGTHFFLGMRFEHVSYPSAATMFKFVFFLCPSFRFHSLSYLLSSQGDLDTPSPSNDSPSMSVVPASQTRWAYGAAPVVAPRAPLKPVNDVPLTRDLLVEVLSDLSERLYRSFGRQVCLIVHGGGVMVLHHALQCHGYTQDIDYIHRSFVREYTALGFRDAEQRLRTCIQMTAYHFKLGEDWMNSHADMTLPWAVKWVQPSIMLLTHFPKHN
jgi:hypothetical protein